MAVTNASFQYDKFDPITFYTNVYVKNPSYINKCTRYLYEIYNCDEFQGNSLLDLCCGPTVHWLAAPSRKYMDITMGDLAISNLIEVNKWLQKAPDAIDWIANFNMAAAAEHISDHNVIEERIRKAVKHVIPCDVLQENPVLNITMQFDAVQCTFGVDSAAQDPESLNSIIKNISNVLKPGGSLVMSNTLGATYYTIGCQTFPKICITKRSLVDALSGAGFEYIQTQEFERDEGCHLPCDYKGIIMSSAFKRQ